jgi:iron complex outermembrane receptor protein
MNTVRIRRLLLAAPAAAALAAAAPGLARAAVAGGASAGTTVEDVVVTAQKREQKLQDVPISVTVLGGQQLDRLQIRSGTDIARQTPNLRVSNLGNEDQPKFAIRGIATPDFNLNTTSPIGAFYDEVYVAEQWLGGPQIFDMERIEVLRGPQGTLFGKNTTGGAINFITRAPSFGRDGYVTGEYGSNKYYHVTGAVETPLIDDKLAARLAFNFTQSDGFVKNRYRSSQAKNLSSINNHAFRLSLKYREGDFDATLRLLSSNSNPSNIGIIAVGLNPDGTEADGVNPRVNPYTGQPFGQHEGAYDHSGEIKASGNGGYLTMNKGLGPNFTVTSITSYFTGNFENTVDADGSYVPFFSIDFFAKQHELTQDLRVASHFGGSVDFILGGYFTHDQVKIMTNYYQNSDPLAPGGGSTLALFRQNYLQDRTSYAAYFDGTWDVAPSWQLYGGLRWTKDRGEVHDFTSTSQVLPPFLWLNVPFLDYDNSAPTGRIGVNHHLARDVMAYVQYSRGYRSSAFNGGALTAGTLNVAKPEYLDDVEGGFKSQWLGHRLQVNASAFYYKYRDQQFLIAQGSFSSQEVNADMRSYGLELEATARPTDNLTLTAGLGLLDAKYTRGELPDAANGNVLTSIAGKRAIEAPRSTLNLAADYTVPVGPSMSIDAHMDAVHVTREYFTPFNSAASSSPPFWEANARVAFRDDRRHYEFALWIKNLNQNTAATGVVVNVTSAERFTTIPYPRRYGAEFTYHF